MECTHRKLRTRLTDRLCCDDADCLSDLDGTVGSEIAAIALAAYAMLSLTGENSTEKNTLNTCILNLLCCLIGDLLIGNSKHNWLAVLILEEWMENILYRA